MRERTQSVQRPSLFPFLSVLVCLIGVLTFLAASLALTALGKAQGSVEIEIEAGASKHGKTPVLIECVSNRAFTVGGEYSFDEDDEDKVWMASRKESSYDPDQTPFTRFLRELALDKNKYVLFIVRPEGLSTYTTLRNNISARNKGLRERSVPMSESVEDIPRALQQKGVRHADDKLYCEGRMTPEDRDALKRLVSHSSSQEAVDRLYELCQSMPEAVEYGTELLPSEWELHGAGQAEEVTHGSTDADGGDS